LNFVSELLAVSGAVEAAETGALTGYARKTLTGLTVAEDDTADVANFHATIPTYGETESGTWRAVVFYEEGASDAARALISLHTITPLVTNGGGVTLTEPTDGPIGQG